MTTYNDIVRLFTVKLRWSIGEIMEQLNEIYLDPVCELIQQGITNGTLALHDGEYVEWVSPKEYVYMAKCNDLFKIGRAKDVEKRMKQLQTGNPYKVELWLSWEVNDARKVEAWMHEKFKEQHVRGEWYALDDADIWRVDSIDIVGIESGTVLPHQDKPPAWYVRAFGT